MAYELPELPYAYDALDPVISRSTLEFHHDKHHAAYVANYNNAVSGTEYDSKPIEEVIRDVASDPSKVGIFNNAAQAWNHTFYWNSMRPEGGGTPGGSIAAKIDSDFGGFDKFVEEFSTAGATQFGSGWAWLVLEDGNLKVTNTANAENPLTQNQTPLITIDVWEHAYYLDYQNQRPAYIKVFLEKLVNWDFAEINFTENQ